MSSASLYFRNKVPIYFIEEESLWKLEGTYLVLVDEDLFFRVLYEDYKDSFYQVPEPDELKMS